MLVRQHRRCVLHTGDLGSEGELGIHGVVPLDDLARVGRHAAHDRSERAPGAVFDFAVGQVVVDRVEEIVVFLLIGRDPYRRRTGIVADIETTFRGYITTMTVLSAITSLLVGCVLWLMGVHMAWLFGLLVFVFNIIRSLRKGQPAGSDPWDAWTLEWATSSPPPEYNFAEIPVVRSRRPLWDLKHPTDPDWKYE